MGFYGNITNTSKTNFVFDKIYSNRYSMEQMAETDGVFIGRYVLIEYGTKTPDSFIRAYGPDAEEWYYTSRNQELATRIYYTTNHTAITDTNIYKDMIIYVIDEDGKNKYLRCSGGNLSNNKPKFQETTVEDDLYFYNKNQDAFYQNSRGYDGTVWTKTSVEENGKAVIKYVNIAELNTVVPTFDIAHDAPTLSPITPHFDTDSNNVYYKIHMQPQWGLKVKKAAADEEYSDGVVYETDETVNYVGKKYDPETDKDIDVNETYPGAIYFNRAGFAENKTTTSEVTDRISILPTGKSGNLYNTHDDNYTQTKQVDIQEIVVQLPVIGNTIAKVWDIVYGTDPTSGYRYRDFEWKYTNDSDKDGDSTLGGMTRELDTIAGCINTVHDLMGMIVYNGRPELSTNPDNSLIYFDEGKYYRIGIQYDTEVATEVQDGVDYFVDTDDQSVFTSGTKWNNEVKEIPEGVHLVTRVEEPCWIEMDLGESLDTIHGWILQLSKYFCDDVDKLTRNRETVQGTINYLNDIIDKFDKLVPGEFVVVDEYGRMQSAGYTTQQVYTSTNYGQSLEGTGSDAHPLTEDRWISVDINTSHENPFITIAHKHTPVENNTTTTSDKNDPTDKDGINNDTTDEIYLYAPIVDSTGHIVGKNIETVTLPYGYKTITTNGLEESVTNVDLDDSTGRQSTADNTQDSLAINTVNKWLQIEVTNDKVELAHEIHSITTTSNGTSNANSEDGATDENNINIPDWQYDNAGHITAKQDHYYTLPFGFKTIQTINSTNSGAAPASTNTSANNNTNLTEHVADTTQDVLKFAATNKWVTMQADTNDDVIKFGHVLSPIGAKKHESSDKNITTFGGNFSVLNFTTDAAGHITAVSEDTITIPKGSLNDLSATEASVLTGISMNDETGDITQTNANVGTLQLTEYSNDEGDLTSKTLQIKSNNTINSAFKTIQNYVNDLDLGTSKSTLTCVIDVTQKDGQVAIERAGTDSLQLNGYSATSQGTGRLANNDTINVAFAKLQNQMIAEETARANADTAEKNARIAADTTEKNERIAGDEAERAALNAAIAQEVSDRNDAIDTAIADLIDSAPDNLNTLKEIVEWTNSADANLTNQIATNTASINTINSKLKSAAYETKETFVLKTDYDTMVASYTQQIADLNLALQALTARVETLEGHHPAEEEPTI